MIRRCALFAVGLLIIAAACNTPPPSPSPGAAAATAPSSPATKVGYNVGNRAPEFSLNLADGSTVTSASLANEGKPVFLFFLATW